MAGNFWRRDAEKNTRESGHAIQWGSASDLKARTLYRLAHSGYGGGMSGADKLCVLDIESRKRSTVCQVSTAQPFTHRGFSPAVSLGNDTSLEKSAGP